MACSLSSARDRRTLKDTARLSPPLPPSFVKDIVVFDCRERGAVAGMLQ